MPSVLNNSNFLTVSQLPHSASTKVFSGITREFLFFKLFENLLSSINILNSLTTFMVTSLNLCPGVGLPNHFHRTGRLEELSYYVW